MLLIRPPTTTDLPTLKTLLLQWIDASEVAEKLSLIEKSIKLETNKAEYFYIVTDENIVVGIGGLAPVSKILFPFTKTKKAGEITIFYLDKTVRGKGYGSTLLNHVESEAREQGYLELFVRSMGKYECTAYDFYGHKGYSLVATLADEVALAVHGKLLSPSDTTAQL